MNPKWTDQEIEMLRLWWPRLSAKSVARKVGRSYPATYQKALALALEKRLSPEKQVTNWVDRYLDIYPHACLLHKRRVPIEIRTRWMGGRGEDKREQFAMFRIYPRRIEKYREEYG